MWLLEAESAQPWQLSFQDPGSPIMEGIIKLHNDIIFLAVIIGIFVAYLVVRVIQLFDKGVSSYPNRVSHAQSLEIIWTLTPALILMGLAAPSFALLYSMDEKVESSLTLKIIGHQWYWSYEYTDFEAEVGKISFDSYMVNSAELTPGQLRLLEVDNRLLLPVNTHIRCIISSADVLHSVGIPSLALKTDACPGRLNEASLFVNREGTYIGQCSEICGINHGFMPLVFEAVSMKDFASWLISWQPKKIMDEIEETDVADEEILKDKEQPKTESENEQKGDLGDGGVPWFECPAEKDFDEECRYLPYPYPFPKTLLETEVEPEFTPKPASEADIENDGEESESMEDMEVEKPVSKSLPRTYYVLNEKEEALLAEIMIDPQRLREGLLTDEELAKLDFRVHREEYISFKEMFDRLPVKVKTFEANGFRTPAERARYDAQGYANLDKIIAERYPYLGPGCPAAGSVPSYKCFATFPGLGATPFKYLGLADRPELKNVNRVPEDEVEGGESKWIGYDAESRDFLYQAYVHYRIYLDAQLRGDSNYEELEKTLSHPKFFELIDKETARIKAEYDAAEVRNARYRAELIEARTGILGKILRFFTGC